MAAWSSILRSTGQKVLQIGAILPKNAIQNGQVRYMGHGPRVFRITPSRWQWQKTKDLLHFYVMLGVIPLSLITFLAYVFVGPAQLEEIPEGYIPKNWEYYRSPITRFFTRCFYASHQELYERTMHHIYEETQLMKLRALDKKVKELMKQRKDYAYYYYIPYNAEFVYESREFEENDSGVFAELDEATIKEIHKEREENSNTYPKVRIIKK